MSCVEKLDKAIFYCLCIYALTFCVSGEISDKIIGLGVLLGILRCIKERPKIYIPKVYIRALLVFFGVFFLLIFVSPDMARSAREYWRYLNRMFPFLVALFFLSNRKQVIWMGVCLLIAIILNNGYAIYSHIVLLKSQGVWGRASGFDQSYINLAGILVLTMPALSILLLAGNLQLIKRVTLILAFLICCIALFINGTRIAWVIIPFILLLLVFLLIKSWKKRVVVSSIGLIAGAAVIGLVPSVHDYAKGTFSAREASNRGHYFITVDSIHMITDHPVLGVGLGRFQKVFNESYISPQTKETDQMVPHAHNNTLHMLAQTGIIGCAAFWYMFGSFLLYSWRDWKRHQSYPALIFFSATLAITLQGITDYSFGLHPVMRIYFLMLAMYLKYQTYEEIVTN